MIVVKTHGATNYFSQNGFAYVTFNPVWVSKMLQPEYCLNSPKKKTRCLSIEMLKFKVRICKHFGPEGSARCPSVRQESDKCRSWVKMCWYFSSVCAASSLPANLCISVRVLKPSLSTRTHTSLCVRVSGHSDVCFSIKLPK